MADVHSKEIRSYNISRIKGKNTKPEILVRKHLYSNGFRYKLNVKKLPGTPDIVLKKYRTIIFINGSFWHGHKGCKYFVIPKTKKEWWTDKIRKTQERDLKHQSKLKMIGWNIVVIWECQLKKNVQETTLSELNYLLNKIFPDRV